MAFKKHMTIVELFATTILRLLNLQQKDGLVTNMSATDYQTLMDQRKQMQDLLDGEIGNTFLTIMRINARNMKLNERQKILNQIDLKESSAFGAPKTNVTITKNGLARKVELDE